MTTKTNEKPTLPTYSVTKEDAKIAREAGRAYFEALTGIKKAENAIATLREGKWHHIRAIGHRACLDGKKGTAHDRLLSLAAYDALVVEFNSALIEADRKNRQNPGEPMPEGRDLRAIDPSVQTMRSIIRKAIEAGHVILGNESKGQLQEAAGHKNTGTNQATPPGRGARPPAGKGDEPRNVAAESVLSRLVAPLQEVMTEIARQANLANPTQQAVLAALLVNALGEYKDKIAEPVETAPAAAPATETVAPTAAQVQSLKPRARKRAA